MDLLDLDLLRNATTVAAFLTFLGIVWWAYTPSRKAKLQEQALIALEPDDEGRAP